MCNIPHHFSGKLTIPLLVLLAIVLMVVLVAQGVLADQTVTNTNDSGPGSLRQAIESANANPAMDLIAFNIPGPGPHTIQPTSPLPHITDPVIIDGYTQPGAALATDDAPATLLIELDGINVIGLHYDSGLRIHTRNSTVRGLVINRFGDVGIHIEDPVGGNIIEGNYIGTDVTGTLDWGNSDDGVRIWRAPDNTVGGATAEARNIISGNNDMGIEIHGDGATGNKVQGNYIGIDVTGTADMGNGDHGVFLGMFGNTIGGSSSGTGNVISGNGGAGIEINGVGVTGNLILGNLIGTDASGREALGNTSAGVKIISCAFNTLTDNTVSNNRYGIQLESSSDNQIYNNNFIDNTTQAYATNGRRSNIFNLEKPIGGNYWSDWTTPNADGDGFVDSPYVFTGGVDYLPWARQDGWLPTPPPAPLPLAFNPEPTDGAKYVYPNVELSWSRGDGAQLHIVYFGDNFDDVNIDAGGILQETTTYTPGPLEFDKVYYWRVNEFDGAVIHKGDIWSFRTIPEIDPNLIGWWRFDEGSGNIAYDSSGHGNDGTFNGNPQWVSGHSGYALEFDGSGDWLDCGEDPSLQITDAVTVTAWIKVGARGIDHKIGGNQDDANGGYKMTVYSNNRVEFEIRTATNSAFLNRGVSGGTEIEVDVWYHVTGVYSLEGGYIRTYVNGVLDREMSTTDTLGASPGSFKIGCEPFETGLYNFDGVMDDLRIYSQALTEAKILGVMEGSAVYLYASSPNPADGALNPNKWVNLSWSPGGTAVSHDVYFGDNFDDVEAGTEDTFQGNQTATYLVVGSARSPYLVPGVTYYWRIDEVEADGVTIHKGEVWSFTVADPLSEALDSGLHILE